MKLPRKTSEIFYTCGLGATIACCFFIPLSSSIMGGTALLATLFWLCSGRIKNLPQLTRSNPLVIVFFALLIIFAVGLFYSPADLDDSLSIFKKYRELLFFVVVLSLLQASPAATKYCEIGFIAGCTTLLALSYAMYLSYIPTEKYGYSTVYHITHSFFMALLAFWCLQKIFEKNWYRFIWLFLLIPTIFNLFYIAPGRTGMIIFVSLVFLTLLQRLSIKLSLFAILGACILIAGTYATSDNFSTRINDAVDEIQNYQPSSSRTSLGMRFDWWHNSITLIKEKPLWGHGTGSFAKVQGELITGTEIKPSDNPHNEYLLIAVQTGIIGLALFLVLLGGLLFSSLRLKKPEKYLLQGVVMAMGAGCLFNSFLYDSHQGHFFAFLSAVLCSSSQIGLETAESEDTAGEFAHSS